MAQQYSLRMLTFWLTAAQVTQPSRDFSHLKIGPHKLRLPLYTEKHFSVCGHWKRGLTGERSWVWMRPIKIRLP